jgi:hypothetical protein
MAGGSLRVEEWRIQQTILELEEFQEGYNWFYMDHEATEMCEADFSRLQHMAARELWKYFRLFFRHQNMIWGPITDSEPGSFIQGIFQVTQLALRFVPRQIARKTRFGNQSRLVIVTVSA